MGAVLWLAIELFLLRTFMFSSGMFVLSLVCKITNAIEEVRDELRVLNDSVIEVEIVKGMSEE